MPSSPRGGRALGAAAAVGAVLFVLALLLVGDGSSFAPGDRAVRTFTVEHQTAGTEEAARAITALGTFVPVVLVVVVGAVLLVRADRRREAAAIVAGYVVAFLVCHLTKGLVGRPRPSDRLVVTLDSAFPSGHATNAMAWAAVALALRRLSLRPRVGAALVVLGVLLTLAIGLSRIDLRAHWVSDVVGGWGLSVAGFAGAWLLITRAAAGRPARPTPPVEDATRR